MTERPRVALALLLTVLAQAAASCTSRCVAGFTEVGGECVGPDGSGSAPCDAAQPGLYAGQTDQGLPISFELTPDRSQVRSFAIDTEITGQNGEKVRHEIRWGPGFPILGCTFGGRLINSEFAGSFRPPSAFVGSWADSVAQDVSFGFYTGSGTWTAQFQGPVGDGGTADGGPVADGGPALDGGLAEDGGPVADGGPSPDGGTGADGGAGAGGGVSEITVPAGFTSEVYAQGLSGPVALAVEATSGDLYVAEHFAGTVARIPRSAPRSTAHGGLSRPRGLSLVPGSPDRLYVSHEGGIEAIEIGGSSAPFGPPLSFAAGPLACDATPRCFVAELDFGERGQAVWEVGASAAAIVADAANGIDQPIGLALGRETLLVAEGNLGFPSADGVLFHDVSLDGGVAGFTPVPLVAQPGALAPLAGNLLFVAEVDVRGGGGRQVFLLDRAARTTRPFASGFSLPLGIAFDASRGDLFVADLNRGAVYRVRGPFGAL